MPSSPPAATWPLRLEERLRAAFDEPFMVGSESLRIRISLGVATATGGEDVRRLLRRADQAMYADKRQRQSVPEGPGCPPRSVPERVRTSGTLRR